MKSQEERWSCLISEKYPNAYCYRWSPWMRTYKSGLFAIKIINKEMEDSLGLHSLSNQAKILDKLSINSKKYNSEYTEYDNWEFLKINWCDKYNLDQYFYAKKKIIPNFSGQILIYPWIDLTMSRPSMNIKLNGILVEKETLLYFSKHYLNQNEEQVDWRVSPILYPDLSNIPPTFIYSAGIDPLVDEGDALRRRLSSFGNEVYYKLYPGQMHAFASNIVNLPTSLHCIDEASKAIIKIFNRA